MSNRLAQKYTLPLAIFMLLGVCHGRAMSVPVINNCQTEDRVCIYASPNAAADGSGKTSEDPVSIDGAQQLAIDHRRSNPSGRISVILRGGRYELKSPINITPEISGEGNGGIEYINYPGEQPVLTGATAVGGWVQYKGGIYSSKTAFPFRQLFIDGQWAQRARTPGNGNYFRLKRWYLNKEGNQKDPGNQRLVLNAADVTGGLSPGVEIHVQRVFNVDIYKVADVRTVNGESIARFDEPGATLAYSRAYPQKLDNQAYHLEGSLDFVDEDGEWYQDNRHVLYLKWKSLSDLQRASVRAPRLQNLMIISGRADKPVTNVRISGIHFAETTWTEPDRAGFIPGQGAFYTATKEESIVPGAISIHYASRLHIDHNLFYNLGGAGIVSSEGLTDSSIESNEFHDIAGGGIVLAAKRLRNPAPDQMTSNISVIGNSLSRIGKDYPGSVAIIATYVRNLLVKDNAIRNVPYTGISVGWGWTKERTVMANNAVISNTVDAAMSMLSDGAALYFLSNQPNSIVKDNQISNIRLSPWAVAPFMGAIYLDAGSSGISLENNSIRNIGAINERNHELFNQRGNPPIRSLPNR